MNYFSALLTATLVLGGCNLFEEVPGESTDHVVADVSLDMGSDDGTMPPNDMVDAAGDSGGVDLDAGVEQPRWEFVTAGRYHTCGLTNEGVAYCWGRGGLGQLGHGDVDDRAVPNAVLTDVRFSSLSAGAYHTCGIERESSALYCWGVPHAFGVGDRDSVALPVLVDDDRDYAAVAAGEEHTCATSMGSVYCVGQGGEGQLGLGSTDDQNQLETVQGASAETVVAGNEFTCALSSQGDVFCWGTGLRVSPSETGVDAGDFASPSVVEFERPVVEIVAGDRHACAILDDGQIACWGAAPFILEEDQDPSTPSPIASPFEFTSVSSGEDHGCGITVDGVAFCWGSNYRAALGIGGEEGNPSTVAPVTAVNTRVEFESVSGGGLHNCALTPEGDLYCWGQAEYGRLGNGDPGFVLEPARVESELEFTRVAAGEFHTCAVRDSRAVCWGRGRAGQQGNDSTDNQPQPVEVQGIGSPVLLATTNRSNCAIDHRMKGYCWGRGNNGTLGNGDTWRDKWVATEIAGGHAWSTLAAGLNATCGISMGRRACWGSGSMIGEDVGQQSIPYFLDSGNGAVRNSFVGISVGDSHVCSVDSAGDVECWGRNSDGQLGNRGTADSLYEAKEASVDMIEKVVAFGRATCAIDSDEELWCWGDSSLNASGGGDLSTPEVVSQTRFQDVIGSSDHACAIDVDGGLWCWGSGAFGKLGNRLQTSESQPVEVQMPGAVTDVSTGVDHTCAVLESGEIYCWGRGEFGRLGDGNLGFVDAPILIEFPED